MRRWLPALILLLPLAALLPFSMVEPDGTEAPAHPRAGPDLFTDPATWDATYEKAHAAYKAEEYQTAIALLLPIAIDGHAPSQTLFGYMQELGLGMSKNACYARIWYDRAARAGHPEAQLLLGAYYNAIYGRQPNLRLYYYWVMMADRNGFDPARSISGDDTEHHLGLFEEIRKRPDATGLLDDEMVARIDPRDMPPTSLMPYSNTVVENDLDLLLDLLTKHGVGGCEGMPTLPD